MTDFQPDNVTLSRRRLLTGAATLLISHSLLWTAPAAAQVIDSRQLGQIADRARELDQLNSLIIARDGEVQFAEALRGPGLDRTVNIKSVSKTLMAALVGIALDRGILDNVNQSVAELLPDSMPNDADPRIRQITVDHLLTMRAGLERTSGPNYGRWVASDNWVRFALSRPIVAEPGGRMLYSTGSYHLLAAILTRLTGSSVLALARDWLGEPLAIAIPPWTRDPQGIYMGGNNMALSPNALLKFGEMYRRQGRFDDRQIISRNWVETSWQPRTRSPFSGDYYGYGWFIDSIRGHGAYYARGYGGQLVYLVPELGLTVVITSDPTRPARSGGYFSDLKALLTDQIIPAAEQT